MAEKCKREKKALDKAIREREKAEGRLGYWDEQFEEWEAEAQRALGSAVSDCTRVHWVPVGEGWRSEQRLDEECLVDRWLYAYKLLDAAQRFREGSVYVDLWARLEAMRSEEEFRKDAYCACVNGETPS